MSTFTPTQQTTSLTSSEAQSVDMGPADELIDPQRHELITQLLYTIGEPRINSTAWACLWFADLSNIRGLLEGCYVSQVSNIAISHSLSSESFNDMMKAWAVRSKNQGCTFMSDEGLEKIYEDPDETEIEETPTKKRRRASDSRKPSIRSRQITKQEAQHPSVITSSATAGPTKESTSLSPKKSTAHKAVAKRLCKERDNDMCVLTGFLEPLEVAHVCPYGLGQKEEKPLKEFWAILRMFWTRKKVDAWKKQVSGPHRTETCSNMMCMVNVAQKLWEKARFALKPLSISEDQKVLTVQFYWLPRHSYSRRMPAIKTPGPFPGNLSSSTVNGEHIAKLFNIATDTKLCSGDVITFETNDPIGHPLPSMELLNMQWVLHRVLALSGVADATDEDLESELDRYLRLVSSGQYQEDTESDTEEEEEEE
ncbi:hypothetical protein BDV39DRAFT_206102 [Aspergillus sergii]|uniref:HNH nuclease domain-containing protein n=1 Tax=Aspergillus sergii TaxID=1034303 RepID=A0A5N6X049_9EURO|nr:hypothetical protein BDV39DRAFT_206102 [Aspergillus sergii]